MDKLKKLINVSNEDIDSAISEGPNALTCIADLFQRTVNALNENVRALEAQGKPDIDPLHDRLLALEKRVDYLQDMRTMSVSQFCRKYHLQNCHKCEDINCGDNLNKPTPAPEPEKCPPQPKPGADIELRRLERKALNKKPEPVCETCNDDREIRDPAQVLRFIPCPSCQPAKLCGTCDVGCTLSWESCLGKCYRPKPAKEEGGNIKGSWDSEVSLFDGSKPAPKPQGEAWLRVKIKNHSISGKNVRVEVPTYLHQVIMVTPADLVQNPGDRMEKAIKLLKRVQDGCTCGPHIEQEIAAILKEAELTRS